MKFLTKREAAIGLVVFLIGIVFWALGCGGGGGSSSPASLQASGKVVLPAGFKLPLSRLAVSTVDGQTLVAANGTFSAPVGAAGPSLVQLIDTTTDKIVLLGYVDPAATGSDYAGGKGEISAKTSATALLYFALEGFMLPTANMTAYRSSIASSSQVSSLVTVISSRVVANPTAISDGDSQINSAVSSVQAKGPKINPALVVPKLSAPGVSVTHLSMTRDPGDGDQLLVQPSEEQSGVEIIHNAAGTGIVYVNHFRRRAAAYVYEVSNTDFSGNKTPVNPPKEVVSGISVDPSSSLNGVVGTIGNALSGNFAFLSATSGPTNLVVEPGVAQTDYVVVVVGPSNFKVSSVSASGAVAGASSSEQQALIKEWQAKVDQLTAQEVVIDIIGPAIANWLVSDTETKDILGARESTFFADLAALVLIIPDAFAAIQKGNIGTAVSAALTGMADTTEFKQQAIAISLKAIGKTSGPGAQKATAALNRLFKANCIIDEIDTILATVDIVKVLHDSYASLPAETWTANVIPPKFNLTPGTSTIDPGNVFAQISVSTPTGIDLSDFRFQWSVAGTMGSLTTTTNETAPLPTTPIANTTVEYIGNTSKMKLGLSDTVTVQVFAKGDLSHVIGKATAKVTDGVTLVCGTLPPPIMSGVNAPTLTTDKPLYHAGEVMTAVLSLPLAGAPSDSTWEVDLVSGPEDQATPATVLTVDGAAPKAGSVVSGTGRNTIGVTGSTGLDDSHAQKHTIKFKINTPTDASGQPKGYCAGGLQSGSFIGPNLFGSVFFNGGGGTLSTTFVNLSP